MSATNFSIGCLKSSVDLSASTILLPRVRIPSIPSWHFSFIVKIVLLHCFDHIWKKIDRSITTVCRNKAIWLVVTSHMTIFNPKECIIQHSKVMLCKNLFMILTLGQKCLSWTVTVATTGSRHQYFRIAQFRYPKICLWHRLWDSNPWASDLKSRHRPRSRRCRRRQICK